ncbi:MAG: DUF937 domain-containing protein [Saprospiraceae bacterium]
MSNTLNTVKGYLSPEILNEASKYYNENEVGISKAIHSMVPTILLGILQKCGDSHSIDDIFTRLRSFSPAILDNLGNLLSSDNPMCQDKKDQSAKLVDSLLGAKAPAITNAIAAFSGVKPATVSGLFGLVGPLVMGLLSKKISDEGLNPSTLVRDLLAQKNTLLSLLPSGVGSLIGIANADQGNGTRDNNLIGGKSWVLLLLPLIVLAGLLYYWLKC